MKSLKVFYMATVAAITFASCADAPESHDATTTEAKDVAAGTGTSYKVDPASSKVEWIGTKVSRHHQGYVNIKSGTLDVKDGAVTGGNFVMDMTSIKVTDEGDTASNNKLNGHLLSPDFFDAKGHPEATFAITDVQPFTGTVTDSADKRQESISKYKVTDPTHTISGNLTIKGISKNITFPAKVTVTDNSVDAMAKFNIDRKLWNIVYPGQPDDLIRDQIHLGIGLKASK